MKYNNRSFFLIRGKVLCKRIVGRSQSFVLCEDKGYVLKRITPSSTFLICDGGHVSPIRALLEVRSFEKENIDRHLQLSTLSNMVGYSADDLKIKHKLGDREFEEMADRLFLVRYGTNVYKLSYRSLLTIASYIRSLKLTQSSLESELSAYNDIVKNWSIEKIKGTKAEVCLFFVLSCWEAGDFRNWKKSLENILLEKISVEEVREAVKSSNVAAVAKNAIMESLL